MLHALRHSLAAPLALAALATTGLAAVTSGAFFTDADTVTGNVFTTGTVRLDTNTVTTDLSLNNMAPGAVKVGAIKVVNTGSLAERYSVVATADNTDGKALASALRATVKTGVAICTEAGFDNSGTVLYTGILGTPEGTALVGNPAQGQHTGDRSLAAGAAEDLCVKVALPTSAGDAVQSATTTANFAFSAEQVINNP